MKIYGYRCCDYEKRKELGITQAVLAEKLNVSYQAVSKWEQRMACPEISLLPMIADALETSIDSLFGYKTSVMSDYEQRYQSEVFYWGLEPNGLCYEIMKLKPPVRPTRVLDMGCGEGKDAIFLARNGYIVSTFDLSERGLEKGTVLADHFSRDEIEIESFDSTQIEKIRTVLKRMSLSGFVTAYTTGKGHTYKGHKWYLKSRSNPGFLSYLEEHKDDKRLQGVLTEKELFQGSISYFTFIGDKDELDPAYDYVKKLEDINYNYEQNKYRSEYWLEIFPKNATKAKAIEKLKKQYACDKVVVFGDSFNDEPMFQIADEAYAVANAEDRIKELATGIIDSNDNDGIAKFLKGWNDKN